MTTGDDIGDRTNLRELALANLRLLIPKVEAQEGVDGILIIDAGGALEAGLLLSDRLWSSGQIRVDGDIAVAVPAMDALLVAGSHNPAGLTQLHRVAARLATGPYAVSRSLFVYRDGKFVRFDDLTGFARTTGLA